MSSPPLRRSDGGPLVAALSAVAAAGALTFHLLPTALAVVLIVAAALAVEAGRRELRIRRRLRKLGPANRAAAPAASLHIDSGAL